MGDLTDVHVKDEETTKVMELAEEAREEIWHWATYICDLEAAGLKNTEEYWEAVRNRENACRKLDFILHEML